MPPSLTQYRNVKGYMQPELDSDGSDSDAEVDLSLPGPEASPKTLRKVCTSRLVPLDDLRN